MIIVSTDGSCLRNPGGAIGWAWVNHQGPSDSGGAASGTNQIAELRALRCRQVGLVRADQVHEPGQHGARRPAQIGAHLRVIHSIRPDGLGVDQAQDLGLQATQLWRDRPSQAAGQANPGGCRGRSCHAEIVIVHAILVSGQRTST